VAVKNTVKHHDYHYNEPYIIATELKIITSILQFKLFYNNIAVLYISRIIK